LRLYHSEIMAATRAYDWVWRRVQALSGKDVSKWLDPSLLSLYRNKVLN
jgi:hypothetical protein